MEELKVPILSTRASESAGFGESPKVEFLARVRGRSCTIMHAYQHLWRSTSYTSCLITQSYNSIEAGHAQCTALSIWRITVDQRGESSQHAVWIGVFWWKPVGFFWAIWQERLGSILIWNVVRSSLPKLPCLKSCFGAYRTKITNGSCWIIRLRKQHCSVGLPCSRPHHGWI